ncbi:dTDP-4-dehydrorhamnose 3,5-epimerase [Brevundimonas sp. 2R-24]|uniref:dTDP-4-dehydrorhamnose 3,5-epimerase n=1 Tax=Peiella sedimenti TaxID=3061083 RepID=A0ABT8SKF8_9CAUL|nr:dTDP-4-dehydrorhamnose 3,5-epimerase [Caulobacteraceae bacterium XZ-24]
MEIEPLALDGVLLLRPRRHRDARGWFAESWAEGRGAPAAFVQDNLVFSERAGTVRGLHYQAPPHAQAKLVTVLVGRIRDACVDVRKGSPTYGRSVAVTLDAERGEQLYVPRGFLHGYVTLTDGCLVAYKVDGAYAPASEGAVRWDDPDLAIDWGWTGEAVVSDKDAVATAFKDFVTPFEVEPS